MPALQSTITGLFPLVSDFNPVDVQQLSQIFKEENKQNNEQAYQIAFTTAPIKRAGQMNMSEMMKKTTSATITKKARAATPLSIKHSQAAVVCSSKKNQMNSSQRMSNQLLSPKGIMGIVNSSFQTTTKNKSSMNLRLQPQEDNTASACQTRGRMSEKSLTKIQSYTSLRTPTTKIPQTTLMLKGKMNDLSQQRKMESARSLARKDGQDVISKTHLNQTPQPQTLKRKLSIRSGCSSKSFNQQLSTNSNNRKSLLMRRRKSPLC